MRGRNEWLERDVHDRQAELRGVSARVGQLRNELGCFSRLEGSSSFVADEVLNLTVLSRSSGAGACSSFKSSKHTIHSWSTWTSNSSCVSF
jgi:hypothetical protein